MRLKFIGKARSGKKGSHNLTLWCIVRFHILLYRTIGVGFSSLCARIGGMAAPYIVVRKNILHVLQWSNPHKILGSAILQVFGKGAPARAEGRPDLEPA